jgi:very-short-patch-repair endonuclease
VAVDRAADERVMGIAAQQAGQITITQLLGAGLTRAAVRSRYARGFLTRRGRGVYAVAGAWLAPHAAERAAVLECGDGAVLSHRTAANLWGLTRGDADRGPISLTAVGRDCRRPGLKVHRTRELDPRDRRELDGLPVTSPARTLIDFAAEATNSELAQALNEARARKLVTDEAIEAAIARAPNRNGVAALRALLKSEHDRGFTRSEAERLLRRLVAQARLPVPKFNARLRGFEVDAFWPDQRLVVEVDGWDVHRKRSSFESDRARDRTLTAAGYRVIRVTWWQLTREPMAVAAAIAAALARA